MRFFVGTSSFSHKEWKGSFYPEKLPQKEMLRFYGGRFATVEINATFYRMPTESLLNSWASQVPESFRFVLKAPQLITHRKRLINATDQTTDFLSAAASLKSRLGPLLFQLPPNFKKDVPRLASFLQTISDPARVAFEFRHESWFDDDVFDCLRANACALCTADTDDDKVPTEIFSTARWGYLRLRREKYTTAQLRKWIVRIKSQPWDEAYIFFKHEDAGTGPKFAAQLLKLIDS
jgi:uncharacterized protein YecE (DUF72 family)